MCVSKCVHSATEMPKELKIVVIRGGEDEQPARQDCNRAHCQCGSDGRAVASSSLCKRNTHLRKRRHRRARRLAHWGVEPRRPFRWKRRSTGIGPREEWPETLSRSTRQLAIQNWPTAPVENTSSERYEQHTIERAVTPSCSKSQESIASSK